MWNWLFLAVVLLGYSITVFVDSSSDIVFACSKYRQNRKLSLSDPTERMQVASQIQCISLCLRSTKLSCVAVNYGPKGECELLPKRLCHSTDLSLEEAEGFMYFDVDPKPENEKIWETAPCQNDGRCSGNCPYDPLATVAAKPTTTPVPLSAPPTTTGTIPALTTAPPVTSASLSSTPAPTAAPSAATTTTTTAAPTTIAIPESPTTTSPPTTTAGPCGSGWWVIMNRICLKPLWPGEHKGIDAMKDACKSESANLAGFDNPSDQLPAIAQWLYDMAQKAKDGGQPEVPPLFVDIHLKESTTIGMGKTPHDWIYTTPTSPAATLSFSSNNFWTGNVVPGETKDKPCVVMLPSMNPLSNRACDDSSAGGLCLKKLE